MNTILKISVTLAAVSAAIAAHAQVTFYEREGFEGQSFTTEQEIGDFDRYGFNDRASSVVVRRDQWEVCDDAEFHGRCVVLRPGKSPSLSAMSLNDRISSVRAVSRNARIDENRYAPAPQAGGIAGYRRRGEERLYEANVVSSRAIVGRAEERCWVERENVTQERSSANVPAAIAGAMIGGILGHQVGGGSGKDLATVGGLVVGAAVGAKIGRDDGGQRSHVQEVERCATVSNRRPEYWDVTYYFRGVEHHVQMTSAPGNTVTINEQGEPRE